MKPWIKSVLYHAFWPVTAPFKLAMEAAAADDRRRAESLALAQAPWARCFVRFPVGSELVFIGIRMRVVAHAQYYPARPCGNGMLPSRRAGLTCAYVDGDGCVRHYTFDSVACLASAVAVNGEAEGGIDGN